MSAENSLPASRKVLIHDDDAYQRKLAAVLARAEPIKKQFGEDSEEYENATVIKLKKPDDYISIVVEKLRTRDFYRLVLALRDLPKNLTTSLGEGGTAEFMAATQGGGEQMLAALINNLPRILAVAFDEVIGVVAAAVTPGKRDESEEKYHARVASRAEQLQGTYPEELIQIIRAWIEVNDLAALAAELKNVPGLQAIKMLLPGLKATASNAASSMSRKS